MNAGPLAAAAPRLSRAAAGARQAAPVRIVHLGLGNFFRAHQAWYTDQAPDAAQWGIAAFTGRRPAQAEALAPQDGLYTLVTKGRSGDSFDVIGSVSAVHAVQDHAAWLGYLRSPQVAIVTLTVTEAGYVRGTDGGLDAANPQVQEDVAALRSDPSAPVGSVPARLFAGLVARRGSGSGRIAIMPCDNLPDNGAVVRRVVRDLAALVDPDLAAIVDEQASFVTTMVDRITPETTDEDRATVTARTGLVDASPVPTEPFSEWVISGEFPAGRPAWDQAGARIVDAVEPFEQRKLWLLNGSHSLLAYAASIRGHETVAAAVADPTCRAWVDQWWDEAAAHLTLPAQEVTAYRGALLERFANPRIRHLLAQIAADGSQKIPVRILPALRAERAAGRMPVGATRAVAAWICHLRGLGAPVKDPGAGEVVTVAQGEIEDAVSGVLAFLGVDDAAVASAVAAHVADLTS